MQRQKSHGRRGSDIRALWIRSPSNLRSCALVHLDRYPFTFFDDEPGSGHVCGYRCRVRIAAEEKLLVERYPEYKEYAKRTKRIIPFLI